MEVIMLKTIFSYIPIEYVVYTTLVILAIVISIVRITPLIIKWFHSARLKTNQIENLSNQIEKNTRDIDALNKKITSHYDRVNVIDESIQKQQEYIKDSLEEREIILKSLLCIIQGLQELGTNGPTKTAESEIQSYLLKKSHEVNKNSVNIS